MAFATYQEVETRLGRSLSSEEQLLVEAALEEVTSIIQVYTGQRFEIGTATTTVKTDNGSVYLPQRPVRAITALQVGGQNYTTYNHDGDTLSGLPSGTPVTVTYEYGYIQVPDAIKGVAIRAALRALNQSNGMSLASVTVGGYTETYSQPKADSGSLLGVSDRLILDRFRFGPRTIYTR